jgi:hypothetical protein
VVIDNDNTDVTCSVETPVATFGNAVVKLKSVVSCQSVHVLVRNNSTGGDRAWGRAGSDKADWNM